MILTSWCWALCQSLLVTVILAGQSNCQHDQVERWGIFEKSLQGPTKGNPFVDTNFTAIFTNKDQSVSVPGFYDGNGTYRVRFSPPEVGRWSWRTESNAAALDDATGSFRCKTPSKNNHGPVSVSKDGYHFVYADGKPFRQVGTTSYAWAQQSNEKAEQTLRTLKKAPFNKIRMLFFNNVEAEWTDPFVLTGPGPTDWDPTRYNISYWQRYEEKVRALGDLGVQADIVMFHPYNEDRRFSNMARPDDERYVRYMTARFSAFRHVWWSLANEYDAIDTKDTNDWDHLFRTVQTADPHNRLRSIHQINVYYDARKPWVTHASVQNGAAVEGDLPASLHRDFALKAVVFDEVKYEGNSQSRWGNMTGEEMVMRFWWGTVGGTYVGHGETYSPNGADNDGSWLGKGGKLQGTSPRRLEFLRKVLEDAPEPGIEPIEPWWDRHIAGKPFEYYIQYLGKDTPTEYEVTLPGRDDDPKVTYSLDIIDTWGMTITPVKGTFTMVPKDGYNLYDPKRPTIKLPGEKWMAVRYRKVA